DTNVLITRFLHPDGIAEVEDYMPVGPGAGSDAQLVRRVRVVRGRLPLEVECRPAFDYARARHVTRVSEYGARFDGPDLSLGLAASVPLRPDGNGAVAAFSLGEGQNATFVLRAIAPDADPGRCPGTGEAEDWFRETIAYWQRWAARCTYRGRWREVVLRSALALKLLTYQPTGAIIAAPTTSLPEGIGGVRNWDYRYTWIRDSSFTLDALGQLGYYGEARDYFHFLHDLDIKRIDNLRILYSIRGEYGDHLAEEELTHLEGYQGSRPVRIGNGAATQRQMDVYGEVLAAAYSYLRQASNRNGHRIHERVRDLRTMSELIADYVANHWHE